MARRRALRDAFLAFLIAAVAATAAAASQAPAEAPTAARGAQEQDEQFRLGWLVVVGDVGPTWARVLIENPSATAPELHDFEVQVSAAPAAGWRSLDVPASLLVRNRPRVLQLRGLHRSAEHRVLHRATGELIARFQTLPEQAGGEDATQEYKVLVVSCDRFAEDGDSLHWHTMAAREGDHVGMIHLGDQIYADQLVALSVGRGVEGVTDMFRQLYRKTWMRPAVQSVLRRGAHWMLPDDHEIVNNLDSFLFARADMRSFIEAGRRAFLEYQYQLVADIPMLRGRGGGGADAVAGSDAVADAETSAAARADDSDFAYAAVKDIFFAKRVGATAVFFLDTRYQRTFSHDETFPLLGGAQWEALQQALRQWGGAESGVRQLVLPISVPLLLFSERLAHVIHLAEREMYTTHTYNLNSTLQLLDVLREFGQRTGIPVTTVGGDVHMYANSSVCHAPTGFCLEQLIASGMSVQSTVSHSFKLSMFQLAVLQWSSGRVHDWAVTAHDVRLTRNYAVMRLPNAPGARVWWAPVVQPPSDATEHVVQWLFDYRERVRLALLGGLVGLAVYRVVRYFS